METIADFHLHSYLSRACSKAAHLEGYASWAVLKGVNLLGTGDFTHPQYFNYIKEKLIPAEPGLFKLKQSKWQSPFYNELMDVSHIRFILTVEISNIYKKNDRTRKNHNIVFAPDFKTVETINKSLDRIGNIASDGRPILGLDAKNLLNIVLEASEDAFLVPAHIWTPWFSLLGSKSGFDSVEECFEELSPYIFSLETGLSSDPPMNWKLSQLDRYTLISNSDAHSPANLAREANVFSCARDYFSIKQALQNPEKGFNGTIEFFPEEGKYHFDGHRKCNIMIDPAESNKLNNICPVCGKPLTVGVMNRVEELADRKLPIKPKNKPGFTSLIPLPEILGEILGVGSKSKRVSEQYSQLISLYNNELDILRNIPIEDLSKKVNTLFGEAIKRLRKEQVYRKPGYDGEFGVITVFNPDEIADFIGQKSLFTLSKNNPSKEKTPKEQKVKQRTRSQKTLKQKDEQAIVINDEQKAAIAAVKGHHIITAGPGTGKTFTLTSRIVNLIQNHSINPNNILAITFTNRAAREMQQRLYDTLGSKSEEITIQTFHSFCFQQLKKAHPHYQIMDEAERSGLISQLFSSKVAPVKKGEINKLISLFFCNGWDAIKQSEQDAERIRKIEYIIRKYENHCQQTGYLDIEGLIYFYHNYLTQNSNALISIQEQFPYVLVDEFQDVNTMQYELIKLMAYRTSCYVIGDPNQSIYGFRGSRLQCFFDFQNDFNPTTHNLVRNYRSAQSIIHAANKLIQHNSMQNDNTIQAITKDKGEIFYFSAPSEASEAEFIIETIENVIGGITHFSMDSGRVESHSNYEYSFKDIAVLYRLNQQKESLQKAFHRSGIPYQIVGEVPYFKKKPLSLITAILFYLESMVCSCNDQDVNNPLLQDVFLKKVKQIGKSMNIPVINITNLLEKLNQQIAKPFLMRIEDLITEIVQQLEIVIEDQEIMERFLELSREFHSDLSQFCIHLKFHSGIEDYTPDVQKVTLSTLHAAKGLEFPVVYITGLEQGVLPLTLFNTKKEATNVEGDLIEEERRLFYVGLTRAKQLLYLTNSQKRKLMGKTQLQNPSPFLSELPDNCYQAVGFKKLKAPKKPLVKQLELY